jgi:16S rRNA (adenine1518-N6/adenine1519-N6)-dimethyltransferase
MSRAKALGQHFLSDRSILRKIVGVIDPRKDELIIEIGPGRGALTFPLSERAGKVIAVEKDSALIPFLRESARENLIVLERDVLEIDFRELLASEPGFRCRVKIVGNLPYSISSPLLFKVFDDKELFSACVFLLQKEVAQRVAAGPGSKSYAPLSILFQLYFEVRLRLTLAPGAFFPPPKVQSALVSLVKRPVPQFEVADEDLFRRFLRAAFAQRRKTLINNLKSWTPGAGLFDETVRRLGLKETVRAEELSIGQFAALFRLFTGSEG